jgi:hypothetical protein
MKVGESSFEVSPYSVTLFALGNETAFNHVLRLSTTRQNKLRALWRSFPWWLLIAWGWLLPIFGVPYVPHSKPIRVTAIIVFFLPFIITVWTLWAHTVVELRYSHEPSPRSATIKTQGGKVAWAVVGTCLTLLVQWVWKHYVGQ